MGRLDQREADRAPQAAGGEPERLSLDRSRETDRRRADRGRDEKDLGKQGQAAEMKFLPAFILALAPLAVMAADEQVPVELLDVNVEQKLNAQLPLDTSFTNEMGQQVKLRDCIPAGKPAVLQLGYFGCPMLCDTVS